MTQSATDPVAAKIAELRELPKISLDRCLSVQESDAIGALLDIAEAAHQLECGIGDQHEFRNGYYAVVRALAALAAIKTET